MDARWRVFSLSDPRWEASGCCSSYEDTSYFCHRAKEIFRAEYGEPPTDLTEATSSGDSGILVRGLDDARMDPEGPAIQSTPDHPRWTHVPTRKEAEDGYFTRKVW